jgi:hypothetical protein
LTSEVDKHLEECGRVHRHVCPGQLLGVRTRTAGRESTTGGKLSAAMGHIVVPVREAGIIVSRIEFLQSSSAESIKRTGLSLMARSGRNG